MLIGCTEPIQIIHADEEDEPDMMSDEEEYVLENGTVAIEDVFGFGDAFINANNNREGSSLFAPRRHRGTGKRPFLLPSSRG